MRVLFIQRQPCIRALKTAAGLVSAIPGVTLGFAAQGRSLTEFYGHGDDLFHHWYRMTDPASELEDAIDAFRPDVIHSHNLPDSLTVLAQDLVGGVVPIVHDVHDMQTLRNTPYEDGFPDPPNPPEMERLAVQRSDAVVTVSDEVLVQLEARHGRLDRSLVLPNAPLAADLPARLPSAERGPGARPRIVYQGSLSTNSSHYDLRDIFRALADAGAHVSVRPSREQPAYRRMAADTRGMTVHSPLSPRELMDVLPRYDWGWAGFNVTLNAAHIDTALPNKAFEYVAAGLPILTLRHRALARFVESEGVGLVLDDPAEAVSRIREVDMPSIRRRVAAARGDFTAEANARRLAALYRDLVGTGVRATPVTAG